MSNLAELAAIRCSGIGRYNDDCSGPVSYLPSYSGATSSYWCVKHRNRYEADMIEVHRKVSERYPGYDQPGSAPPDWFDPTYAGESWDED